MFRPVILLRDFGNLSIPDLLTRARAVAVGTIYTDPAKFPASPVSKANLAGLISSLQAKYDAARNRDTIAVAQQDLAEKLLIQALGTIARYAAPLVYNDKPAIEATGFLASNDESHPSPLPLVPAFTREALDGGGIRVKITSKKDKATASYTLVAVPAASGLTPLLTDDGLAFTGTGSMDGVVVRTDVHNKITIQTVKRSTKYSVWVYATGPAGSSTLSQAQDITTQ